MYVTTSTVLLSKLPYHNVTTSLEYVFVGMDLALASPEIKIKKLISLMNE